MVGRSELAHQLEIEACVIQHEEMKREVLGIIEEHKDSISKELHEMNRHLKSITDAFVTDDMGNPDIAGHRNAHAAMIAAAKAERDFWVDLKRDLAKKGLWGIFVVLLGLLFLGIKAKLGLLGVLGFLRNEPINQDDLK